MAVVIRLKKVTQKAVGRYNFRIIVNDKSKARDTKSIEEIGYYDPAKKPASVKFDTERYEYWVKKGAVPSDTIRSIYKQLKKVPKA